MLVHMQMIQGDDNIYRLAMRIDTTNEIGAAHTMVVDLKESITDSVIRMFQPISVEFKDVIGEATEHAIETVKKQQEEEVAKAAGEAQADAQPEVIDGAANVVACEQ